MSKEYEIFSKLKDLVSDHDKWYVEKCISLNAGDWTLSPFARRLMSSYLYGRANSGNPFKARTHTGSKPIDDIDSLAIELLKRMFEAEFVEYRCLSVTSANSIALRVLTEPNDVQLALAYPRGHSDHREMGSGGHRGLKVFDIPFNDEFNIEIDAFTNLVRRHKPKVVVVGSAVLLFPYPFKAMKEIVDEVRAKILFDGAYALGPVAGGLFEDPLSQGVDMMTGSTSKTLCGPKGALILHNNNSLQEKIRSIESGYIAGYNHAGVAALAVTAAEMLEFGRDFFVQTQKNAKALGKALNDEGFNVIGKRKGYTQSTMIAVDVSEFGGGRVVAEKLEKANILCCLTKLWRSDEPFNGLRLGVTAITRYGMKEKEMVRISNFIRRIVINGESPEKLREEVATLRASFNKVQFCFE